MAYPGFQRGGCLRSGPIREGWGGGGAVGFWPDTNVGGGGGGGGGGGVVLSASGLIQKVGGGGGEGGYDRISGAPGYSTVV